MKPRAHPSTSRRGIRFAVVFAIVAAISVGILWPVSRVEADDPFGVDGEIKIEIAVPAKEDKEEATADGKKAKVDFKERLRMAAERQRARLYSGMIVRIEEIARATELEEPQRKKLEVAAKGAVDRVISEWLEGLLGNADLEGQIGDVNDEAMDQTFNSWGMSVHVGQAAAHNLWTQGIERALDGDQQKKWAAVLAERQQFARKVTIDQWIVLVDEQLRLTAEQREKLAELFEEVLDPSVTSTPSQPRLGAQPMAIAWAGGGGQAQVIDPFSAVKDAPLGKILTESQMERWQTLKPELNNAAAGMGGGGWFMNGGGGVIRVIGNVHGGQIIIE